MSREDIEVKVKGKRKPTDRSSISEGRLNFKLRFEGEVDSSSYVFTGSRVSRLPSYSEVMRDVESSVRLFFEGNINKFMRTVGEKLKDKDISTVQYEIGENVAIPGSAIKGSVRANLEYRFKPFQIDNDYYSYSCYIMEDEVFRESFARRHIALWGEEVSLKREHCGIDAVCILCDMFGTSGLASRTYFSDAIMISGDTVQIPALGNVKVINSGSRFDLEVTAINYDLAELGLLLLGFNIFGGVESEEPLLLGKWKYRYSKVGEDLHGKYFGMIRFKLVGVESYDLRMVRKEDPLKLVSVAKDSLMKEEFAKYLDFGKHLEGGK